MSKDVWMAIKDPESTPESSAAADNKATHSDSKNRIESINNDIYFYAEVRRQNNLTLNKKLDSLGIKYFNYSNSLGMAEVAPINLYIIKDDMTNNELLMKTIKEIYEQYTKIPRKQLNEILKHDLWWDAKTCLEYGLVDEIIGD